MKSINLTSLMGKALLAFSLLFGIAIVSNMTAHAQYRDDRYYNGQNGQDDRYRDRDWRRNRDRDYNRGGRSNDGYPDWGGSYELRQTALNEGFNAGNKAGLDDYRHNRRSGPQSHSDFQNASHGYNSRMGDRYLYQRYYREAFIHGYRDGIQGVQG
jgi:hypothetical protein